MDEMYMERVWFTPTEHSYYTRLRNLLKTAAVMAYQGIEVDGESTIDFPGVHSSYVFGPLQGLVQTRLGDGPEYLQPIEAMRVVTPRARAWLDWQGEQSFSVNGVTFRYIREKKFDESWTQETLGDAMGGFFRDVYDGVVDRFKSKYGGDQNGWPDVFRFAWFVRNAMSHNNRYAINNQNLRNAHWNGHVLGTANNGAGWWGLGPGQLGPGDVLHLAEDLDREARALRTP